MPIGFLYIYDALFLGFVHILFANRATIHDKQRFHDKHEVAEIKNHSENFDTGSPLIGIRDWTNSLAKVEPRSP